MGENEVRIFHRNRGDKDPTPWQADIWAASGTDHHGIGKTPQEALLNAAMHWAAYEKKKADALTP
jgi:hypothetical protein